MKRLLVLALAWLALGKAMAQPDDPYLWLEDVTGEKALAWVREQNAHAEKRFAGDPRYERLRAELLAIFDSRAQIPYVVRMGPHYYNLWRDTDHARGLWRRTRVEDYARPDPPWEAVLDLDALAKAENENWVWKGAVCLRPDKVDTPYGRCLLELSRGGADAVVLREFDVRTKSFVKDGFFVPEAKSTVAWESADTLFIGTDFGPGSRTDAGYARLVKRWRRGTPLAAAQTVFTAAQSDVGAWVWTETTGSVRDWIVCATGVREQEYYALVEGTPIRLDLPRHVMLQVYRNWLLLHTRDAWRPGERAYAAGSLLAIDTDRFMRGKRDMQVVYEPGERRALQSFALTRDAVLVNELDNVRARLHEVTFDGKAWHRRVLPTPDNAQLSVVTNDWDADEYLLTVQGFTTPTTLYAGRPGTRRWEDFRALKALPAYFDATGLVTEQHEATSRDGTRVPYFVVRHADTGRNGDTPTLLHGYGGFSIAQVPSYSASMGRGWLQRGGILVRANLRGGGEFGPVWHRTAQREGRQKTFDDFIAVAEDLVKRGVTRPRKLAMIGGSQGGLLVTGTLVQRPDLFGAAVAQVPITDMLRYHRLLAGASWMGEYGNPEVEADRAFLLKYSPYQNLRADVKLPPLFLVTSTRDDRVHPGHARKFAARLLEYGQPVLYFENMEGGHAAGADNAQLARMWAQTFSFLASELGL